MACISIPEMNTSVQQYAWGQTMESAMKGEGRKQPEVN